MLKLNKKMNKVAAYATASIITGLMSVGSANATPAPAPTGNSFNSISTNITTQIGTLPGFITALAYILYAKGLLGVKPGVASTLILAEPATATILAAVVLNESITLQGWAGIATVAIGLAYLSREV